MSCSTVSVMCPSESIGAYACTAMASLEWDSLPADAGEDHRVERVEIVGPEREPDADAPAHEALSLGGHHVPLQELHRRGAVLFFVLDDPPVGLLDPVRHR